MLENTLKGEKIKKWNTLLLSAMFAWLLYYLRIVHRLILSGWSTDLLLAECSFWSCSCVYLLISVEATSVLMNNRSQSSPCALKDKWFGIVHMYRVKFLVSPCKQDGLHSAPWGSPSAYASHELLLCLRVLTSMSQSCTQSENWQLLNSSSELYNRMATETELTHALALLNSA